MEMTAPSPFSKKLPNFQQSWDSTSLGWFKDCPRLYQHHMLQQWTPRTRGIHLYFGGLYASGVERYAHHRAAGHDHNTATRMMVRWVMENSGEYVVRTLSGDFPAVKKDGKWWLLDDPHQWIAEEAITTIEFTPWESNDPYKNRYTLIRSLIWNVDDRDHSPFKTMVLSSGKPAVELSFNFHVFDVAGHAISLSGHMDEIVEVNGAIFVKDDKTTKSPLTPRYFDQYSPNNQMSLYTVAGRVIFGPKVQGVFVRAAQILVEGTRFANKLVPRPTAVTDEWLNDTRQWIELAHHYAEKNYWPKNDKSCDKFGGCPFRKVCSVSPSHREAWLREDFVKREWNPLESRGDI